MHMRRDRWWWCGDRGVIRTDADRITEQRRRYRLREGGVLSLRAAGVPVVDALPSSSPPTPWPMNAPMLRAVVVSELRT